jgi:transcriptional regulator with XRE-family HTH domain
MTEADVAVRIGISQVYLSTVEHGDAEIGAAALLSIAREFNTSLE